MDDYRLTLLYGSKVTTSKTETFQAESLQAAAVLAETFAERHENGTVMSLELVNPMFAFRKKLG
jgi:hypothetical protein